MKENILIISYIFVFNLIHIINSTTITMQITSVESDAKVCLIDDSLKTSNRIKYKGQTISTNEFIKHSNPFLYCYSFNSPSGQIEITISANRNTINLLYFFEVCSFVRTVKVILSDTNFSLLEIRALFAGCYNLKSVELTQFDISKVTSLASFFSGCSNLISVKFGKIPINLYYMNSMFSGCKELVSIDLSKFDTRKVISMSDLFSDCINLVSLNIKTFNVEMVSSFQNMFANCQKITSLDLDNFKTINAENMNGMFSGCSFLTSINLKNFDVSKLTTMSGMFANCKSLTSLNLTNFVSSTIKDTSSLFGGCISLTTLNIGNFVTEVINMNYMFRSCTSFVSIDLSNFIPKKVNTMKGMFENCESLEYLNISNFDTSNVTDMSEMFSSCVSLSSLDLNHLNTSKVITMTGMFKECGSLTNLKIDKFDVSSVTDMSSMFFNCKLLPHLNISNFKGTNIITMKEMFNGCYSLISLDTDNLIVNKVENLEYMFYSCFNLKSLNLINFNTSFTTNMKSMFFGCKSLIHLNINNFDTRKVTKMENMFRSCESLTSLNLSNFQISNDANYQNIFFGIAENLIYCMNDDFYEKVKNQLNEKRCPIRNIDCFPDWKFFSQKIIFDNGQCVESCNITEKYIYEYEGKCYSSCPKGTTSLYNNQLLCEVYNEIILLNDEKTNEKNKEIIINYENYKFCGPHDFLEKQCNPVKYNNMIFLIINDISEGRLNDLLEDVLNENKMDIINTYDNFIYQITTSFNQKNKIYDNISTINLEQCEDDLKYNYNITQNETLLIFKYDYYIKELLIPIVGYEIFHPKTKKILDINICKKNKTKISIINPVNINNIKENELFKNNPNDIYYKDKCNSYPNEKGVDMTLFDRKNEYNDNNLSLCAYNCDFDEYNNQTKKVKCLCEPQFNYSLITLDKIINKKKLLNNFIDIKTTTNLDVIKCYKLLLSLEGLKNNSGSYIILFIMLIYIIGIFVFVFIEYKLVINKLEKIVKNIKNKKDAKINLNKIKKSSNNIGNKKNKNIEIKIQKPKNNENFENNNSKQRFKNMRKEIKIENKLNIADSDIKNIDKNIHRNNNDSKQKFKNKKKGINLENKINIGESELNIIDYSEAKKIDKRNYLEYYFSLIKTRHPLISAFYPNNDYNSMVIKICLFFFNFSLSLVINSLFFTDETMHKIYIDEGIFNFIYNLPKILYSTLISTIIDILIKKLALSEESILDLKKEKKLKEINDKAAKTKRKLIIKFILFFSICFIFLGIFWFYLGCFCCVYTNTQWHLLKDTIISFIISLIIPFIKNVLPCLIRINSLKDPRKSMYNFSKFLQ